MIKFFKKYLERIERLESIVEEQDRLIDVAFKRHRILFRFTLNQAKNKSKRLESFDSDLEEFSSFLHEVKGDLEIEKVKVAKIIGRPIHDSRKDDWPRIKSVPCKACSHENT